MKHRGAGTFIKTAIYLLMFNFLTESMAGITQPLKSFITLSLLSAFVLIYSPVNLKLSEWPKYVLLLLLLILSVLIFRQQGTYEPIAVALFILAVTYFLSIHNMNESSLYVLFWTSIYYTIFLILYEYSTFAWCAGQAISKYFSMIVSSIVPYDVNYSVTYSGLGITLIFFTFCFVSTIVSDKKNYFLFIKSVILIISLNIFCVIIHSYICLRAEDLIGLSAERLLPTFQSVLFFLLLIPLYVHLRNTPTNGRRLKVRPQWTILLLIIVISKSISSPSLSSGHLASGSSPKVVFFDEGYLDWDIPVFGRYGGQRGGMFGLLTQHLRSRNYEVVVSGINENVLSDAKTLVFTNLNRSLSGDEKNLVWNFVMTGGSLLVLGDHTGKEHIREPYNDLLLPMGVKFNFDSGISLQSKWENGFETRPHFINKEVEDENDLQIWIGASLAISPPAQPVIIGKHAFSDLGDVQAVRRGYLGDMRYSRGERLGDLVLVAESRYGKGRVLVFGDTSPFQNSALALSLRFVDHVFQWLNVPGSDLCLYEELTLKVLLLLAIALLAAEGIYLRMALTLVISLGAMIFFFLAISRPYRQAEVSETKAALAIIDTSHLERINLDLWGEPDGFGGLIYNLIRSGYFPQVLRAFDTQRLRDADLLIIIAPAKPFADREIEFIDEFVRQGRHLILTVGWEERDASQGLLEHFSLGIDNTPLGPVSPSQNDQGLSFYKAWPVIYDKESAESLCQAWDFASVVYKRHGKGGIFLVGDSSFLLNRNLEGLHNYSLPNIMFLRKVINTKFKVAGAIQ